MIIYLLVFYDSEVDFFLRLLLLELVLLVEQQQVVLVNGKPQNKTLEKVLTQRADAYGSLCKM